MARIKTEKKKPATVITSGSVPDEITDLFADALVQFIQAVEQEERNEKEKSA